MFSCRMISLFKGYNSNIIVVIIFAPNICDLRVLENPIGGILVLLNSTNSQIQN